MYIIEQIICVYLYLLPIAVIIIIILAKRLVFLSSTISSERASSNSRNCSDIPSNRYVPTCILYLQSSHKKAILSD